MRDLRPTNGPARFHQQRFELGRRRLHADFLAHTRSCNGRGVRGVGVTPSTWSTRWPAAAATASASDAASSS
uniref:Uncharacterized protein n=1 Tax=Ricinus communis TaxID=3988 RepID=B9TCL8_RICCO|nr:conserved hypothetical protein [Ricinus communis]